MTASINLSDNYSITSRNHLDKANFAFNTKEDSTTFFTCIIVSTGKTALPWDVGVHSWIFFLFITQANTSPLFSFRQSPLTHP